MPLRDHFKPPLSEMVSWEGFHGQWPALLVHQLRKQLPPGFVAEPRVHLGSQVEIDIATFEREQHASFTTQNDAGGVATAVWAPSHPTLAMETGLPDSYEYEVRVYDAQRGRQLVAAIELVSPANKDRPEHRNLFVGKCAALLQKGVAVSIVDLVTARSANLYDELLSFLGLSDAARVPQPPPTYAASCRWTTQGQRTLLEAWNHTLTVGEPLPTLPLWLSPTQAVPLDLELSYEQTCHDLWIT